MVREYIYERWAVRYHHYTFSIHTPSNSISLLITIMSMLAFVKKFVTSQLFTSIPTPTSDFSQQTVIVTGSNTGLGLEAARHLTRLGASKVILAVRTLSKGETAAAEIVRSCNVPEDRVEVWKLDVSDHDSIKAFVKRAEGLDRLDAAVLNAGILTHEVKYIDGVESHIAVNVVGAMLLATLLLPKMRQSARLTGQRGRLTINGSDMRYIANLAELETDGSILKKLNNATKTEMSSRYALSKLLVLYNLRELARRSPITDDSDVLLTVLTPGLCRSELMRDDAGAVGNFIVGLFMAGFARTTVQGGGILVHGVSPELPIKAHGRFLMDCQIVP